MGTTRTRGNDARRTCSGNRRSSSASAWQWSLSSGGPIARILLSTSSASQGAGRPATVAPFYHPFYRNGTGTRSRPPAPGGCWGEPYVGLGADRTPMVSFSAPHRRGRRLVGVVTADLAIDYFRKMRMSLDDLELGRISTASCSVPAVTLFCRIRSDLASRISQSAIRPQQTSVQADFRRVVEPMQARKPTARPGHRSAVRQGATFLLARVLPRTGTSDGQTVTARSPRLRERARVRAGLCTSPFAPPGEGQGEGGCSARPLGKGWRSAGGESHAAVHRSVRRRVVGAVLHKVASRFESSRWIVPPGPKSTAALGWRVALVR